MGDPLLADDFEDGDPFVEGTDDIDGQPWQRAASNLINANGQTIPGPVKANKAKNGNTNNDTIRFIDFERDYVHDPNEYDHAMYKKVTIPTGTTKFAITFDLLMETEEILPGEDGYLGLVRDRLFFDIRLNESELLNGNYTSGKFECNNTQCNRSGSPNDAQKGFWIIPVEPIPYDVPSVASLFVGFFANVDEPRRTTFWIDDFKMTITACQ